MASTLVVVESPNKINILSKILGKKYKVVASCGHIMDLAKKELSIDIDNKFEPTYKPLEDKKKIINNLKTEFNKENIKDVLLCGDIDFEGTFINWSVKTVLKLKNPKTLEFIALTKEEVLKGLKQETYINQYHLEAQQTRRILDRLCGFLISPKLFQIFGSNVSAGRVQSIVTKLIVEKEKEIQEFIKLDKGSLYYLTGDFKYLTTEFNNCKFNKTIEKDNILDLLNIMKSSTYTIFNIEEHKIVNKPLKPFNTSSIQQTCNSYFGYSTKTIMNILQSLFTKGYITYHRTTSVQLSDECLDMCKEYILENYGEKYYNKTIYKDKKENSENSHEAIRYTSNENLPNIIKDKITLEELKIYTLIFNTTLMSQMSNQIINELELQIEVNDLKDNQQYFITKLKYQEFDGFTILKKANENFIDKNIFNSFKKLKNKKVNMIKINANEKYQNPPQRYTEASLVNKLSPKNLNIGRPSTYASIVSKIQDREYVTIKNIEGINKKVINYIIEDNKINSENDIIVIGKENNKFVPTDIGVNITEFMEINFKNIMDYKFTADLEQKMDLIANNKYSKLECLKEFYDILKENLDRIKIDKIKKDNMKILGIHPETKQEIILSNGRYGWFIKMKNIYPEIKKVNLSVSLKNIDINPNEITLEHAIELFKYPKLIGKYENKNVFLNNGRFSYYLMFDNKNISIPKADIENFSEYCENITIDNAIEIIKSKQNNCLFELKDKINTYKIYEGQYGKYIRISSIKTGKSKIIKLPKEYLETYQNLTIKQIKEIKPPKRNFRKFKTQKRDKPTIK